MSWGYDSDGALRESSDIFIDFGHARIKFGHLEPRALRIAEAMIDQVVFGSRDWSRFGKQVADMAVRLSGMTEAEAVRGWTEERISTAVRDEIAGRIRGLNEREARISLREMAIVDIQRDADSRVEQAMELMKGLDATNSKLERDIKTARHLCLDRIRRLKLLIPALEAIMKDYGETDKTAKAMIEALDTVSYFREE